MPVTDVIMADSGLGLLSQEHSYNGKLIWKIPNYSHHLEEARYGGKQSIHSLPFFTDRYGYKMCACVFPTGDGTGMGTHMSFFFVVMKGEFDTLLPWPFLQKVTLTLYDQSSSSRHLCETIQPDPFSSSFQRPISQMNPSYGCRRFVSHDLLQWSKYSFIKDDTIILSVIVDTTGLPSYGHPVKMRIPSDECNKTIGQGEHHVRRMQMAFVGPFGVGKTHLLHNFIGAEYNECESTVGIDFVLTKTFVDAQGGHLSTGPLLTRTEQDVEVTTVAIAEEWKQRYILSKVDSAEQELHELNLDGSRAEGDSEAVGTDNGPQSADRLLSEEQPLLPDEFLKAVEKSLQTHLDKTVIFVDLLDCGGQLSFSVLQVLSFSAPQTIFLLIYNCSLPFHEKLAQVYRKKNNAGEIQYLSVEHLNLTQSEYLSHWLSVLSMLAGPDKRDWPLVIPVGTHAVTAAQEGLLEQSNREIEDLLSAFDSPSIRLHITDPFRVDNKALEMYEMSHLFRKVSEHIQQGASDECVALSFLKMEWLIRHGFHESSSDMKDYTTVGQFADLARRFAGITEQELCPLIDYLDKNGAIRSFSHTGAGLILNSSSVLFLSPARLLSEVAKVLDWAMNDPTHRLRTRRDRKYIECLKEKGIFSKHLSELVWPDMSCEIRRALLEALEKLALLCPVVGDYRYGLPLEAGVLYHMPLCIQQNVKILPGIQCPGDAVMMPELMLQIQEDFVPFALFPRLQVRLIQRWRPLRVNMTQTSLQVKFRLPWSAYEAQVFLVPRGIAACVWCFSKSGATGQWPIVQCAFELRQTLEAELRVIQQEKLHGLTWFPAFQCSSPGDCSGRDQVAVGSACPEAVAAMRCWAVVDSLSSEEKEKVSFDTVQHEPCYCSKGHPPIMPPKQWLCWYFQEADLYRSSQKQGSKQGNHGDEDEEQHEGRALKGHALNKSDTKLYDIAAAVAFSLYELEHFADILLTDCLMSGKTFLRNLDAHIYTTTPAQTHALLEYWIERAPEPKYKRYGGQLKLALLKMEKNDVVRSFQAYLDGE